MGKNIFVSPFSPAVWEIQAEITLIWQAVPSHLKYNLQRAVLYLEDLKECVLEIKKKNHSAELSSILTEQSMNVLGEGTTQKKTYEDAEGRRQKVRMFLYKSKVTFAWQGCNTSVQIQTLCWLKEQVSIPYYTKHLYLLTTFLLPAVAIIHWSPARPWKVFPFNRKKRSLSKPLTVTC